MAPGWLAPGSDPSLLPGPVLSAEGSGNRVLIIDSSGRTLWEFGQVRGAGTPSWGSTVTQVAGSTPGFLNKPTGMELYPPNAIAAKFPAK